MKGAALPAVQTAFARTPQPAVLSLDGIAKSFGGAKALAGVSFDVLPGEIHGLLGKNGSGKSTLVKILAGFHAPDAGGTMAFNGARVDLPLKPGVFRRLGMGFVHQNLGLVPSLSVLENLRVADIALGRGPVISWRAQRTAAERSLGRFGIAIDPAERVDRLSAVDRALVAIVRAFEEVTTAETVTRKPGLLLLDEPTPFLPREGVAKLFGLMRAIKAHGSSVIFISHDIDEVMEITDCITVLRDGAVTGSCRTSEATHGAVVEMIVGRRLAANPVPHRASADAASSFARIEGMAGAFLRPTSMEIHKGEVLGLTGLIGSGYEDLPYLAFGARPSRGGTIAIEGGEPIPLSAMNPKRAMGLGLALLPGDRQGASGVDTLTVADNLFLPDIDRFFRKGRLDHRARLQEAREIGQRYEVRPNDPDLKLSALSGGNAQKVLIARWMNREPRLLLLDEPTQGVDVGTRQQVFAAIRAAAGNGMSVVCASSDTEQLADLCERVLIFARGRVVGELTGTAITKDGIAEACYASTGLRPRQAGVDLPERLP